LSILSVIGLALLPKPNPDQSTVLNHITSKLFSAPFECIWLYRLHLTYFYLIYAAILNFYIATLFFVRRNMNLLMKDRTTGQLPIISYILFSPFFIPTYLYTAVHALHGALGHSKGPKIPFASKLGLKGKKLYVGGRYVKEITDITEWDGIIDMTCEFPENGKSKKYLNIQCWDGQPPPVEFLEEGARFGAAVVSGVGNNGKSGSLMVHCAHGRGRSCLMMCAVLVRAGEAEDWEEAFDIVKKGRSVCNLNEGMKQRLREWTKKYGK
jgi:hypothetical protein